MGALRVTQRMMIDRVLRNLSDHEKRILNLQEQLSTGQKVNRPSDDPLAVRRAVSARTEIAKQEQYLTNISTAGPVLLESETALRAVSDALQRARELTLQGGNSTNNQVQREQIAIEVDELIETVFEQANHITNERYVFGGTRNSTAPFVATRVNGEITAVEYVGNDKPIEIEASEGVLVPINATGSDAFPQTSAPAVDVFETLINIRDNLRAGDIGALQARLAEIDQSNETLMVAVTRIGATSNRLNRIDSNIRDFTLQFEQVLSDNLDADLADVVVNLNAQSNAFQASLDASARVIQPSLLDFVQ